MPINLSVTMAIRTHRLSQQGALIKRRTAIVEKNLIVVFAKSIEKDLVVLLAARISAVNNPDARDATMNGQQRILPFWVQESCIGLVGHIVDHVTEFVAAREWMKINFESLDMLKGHDKDIRQVAVNTLRIFAKAIRLPGVLTMLLNNLKVQTRHNHVYTAVTITVAAATGAQPRACFIQYCVTGFKVWNGVVNSFPVDFECNGDIENETVSVVIPLLMATIKTRGEESAISNSSIDRTLEHTIRDYHPIQKN